MCNITTKMPKCSLKNRILQLPVSTCLMYTLCLITIIQFFGYYGKYNYSHIPQDNIGVLLYKDTNPNLILKKSKLDCKYKDILESSETINSWEVPEKFDGFLANGIDNGSYVPVDCNPLFSVAILVTYRNRQKQLNIFLPYMHNFLRKQNIHYRIYLIEQVDEKPWNKGNLYNIGAKYAIADKYPCLIFHDVDLLPLDHKNIYVCAQKPRHMSSSIDKFRYVLPYDYLVGGALAIKSEQYVLVNGFSNKFLNWGGEDDDFYDRIAKHDLDVLRFPRDMSRYTMLKHRQAAKNTERERILSEHRWQGHTDGLNSATYRTVRVKNQRLFTLIAVRL